MSQKPVLLFVLSLALVSFVSSSFRYSWVTSSPAPYSERQCSLHSLPTTSSTLAIRSKESSDDKIQFLEFSNKDGAKAEDWKTLLSQQERLIASTATETELYVATRRHDTVTNRDLYKVIKYSFSQASNFTIAWTKEITEITAGVLIDPVNNLLYTLTYQYMGSRYTVNVLDAATGTPKQGSFVFESSKIIIKLDTRQKLMLFFKSSYSSAALQSVSYDATAGTFTRESSATIEGYSFPECSGTSCYLTPEDFAFDTQGNVVALLTLFKGYSEPAATILNKYEGSNVNMTLWSSSTPRTATNNGRYTSDYQDLVMIDKNDGIMVLNGMTENYSGKEYFFMKFTSEGKYVEGRSPCLTTTYMYDSPYIIPLSAYLDPTDDSIIMCAYVSGTVKFDEFVVESNYYSPITVMAKITYDENFRTSACPVPVRPQTQEQIAGIVLLVLFILFVPVAVLVAIVVYWCLVKRESGEPFFISLPTRNRKRFTGIAAPSMQAV